MLTIDNVRAARERMESMRAERDAAIRIASSRLIAAT